ncbi:MAG: hypothetical protein V7K26_30275 [Nostoc sp.]|uniref:hypothetical protein n=1 Tax=Nostoc sp. TaxID=1180 RepID=UPI002FF0C361
MNELRFSYLPEIFRQLVDLIPLSGARQSDGVGDRFHDTAILDDRLTPPPLFNSFQSCSPYSV